MAMGRMSLIAYKACTPFSIHRCGITHPNNLLYSCLMDEGHFHVFIKIYRDAIVMKRRKGELERK